ncbi:hypothetical protein [Micromonospora sp. WMMD980]|uniref:hypothetical protein n=1 Tax=Micromonospora sp. WMMD980 TaxID=3016088 RepID=UPI00241704F6|nr:hypothetical protein [Micromonospora sp. WMMD980]MDG4804405.1 hypothetical protein [Micromonospora sp. WMMD980]
MATDEERIHDPAPAGEPAVDRLDLGDAEQVAADQPRAEETRQPVDEPRRVVPPYDRTHKRRNQRPLPT